MNVHGLVGLVALTVTPHTRASRSQNANFSTCALACSCLFRPRPPPSAEPQQISSCSVFADAFCPAGSTKETKCIAVLNHSVPNSDRSDCQCGFGFFEYREGVRLGSDSAATCISCPEQGALCGDARNARSTRIGVSYDTLQIAEGFWQVSLSHAHGQRRQHEGGGGREQQAVRERASRSLM